MPNQPKTPIIGFRCPIPLRETLEQIAAERGRTLTDILILAAEEYADRWRHGG